MIDADSEPDLWRFLRRAGFSEQQIASMSPETRLYHDLGLDGDNLFDTMALLQLDFGVDLSGLEWSRYAPSEGEKLSWMWYWRLLQRVFGTPKPQYRPLTLQMIREHCTESSGRSAELRERK